MRYVYFIRVPSTGVVKVGVSRDPEKRLILLQTAHPERLEFVGMLAGGHEREREIHAELAEYRLQGEWFAPNEKLYALMETAKPTYRDLVPEESLALYDFITEFRATLTGLVPYLRSHDGEGALAYLREAGFAA